MFFLSPFGDSEEPSESFLYMPRGLKFFHAVIQEGLLASVDVSWVFSPNVRFKRDNYDSPVDGMAWGNHGVTGSPTFRQAHVLNKMHSAVYRCVADAVYSGRDNTVRD